VTGTERGDLSEFDDFVVARGAALLRTAYLLTGDRHLAEDLVQAALAKTYRHWKRVRGGSPEGRRDAGGRGAGACGFRHGSGR
jgi:DNA-directed RNA polymerase specialized sigma24 family protein